MVEITNITKSPVQVMVRSYTEVPGSGTRAFTTLIIPGVGSDNNVYNLPDERYLPGFTDRLEPKLISIRHVSNTRKDN